MVHLENQLMMTEHYVMVHKNMDSLLIVVLMHVENMNFLHCKMVMEQLVDVVAIMIWIKSDNMVMLNVEKLEDYNVIMYGEI